MRHARKSLFEPGDVSAAPSVLRVRPASPPPTGPGSEGQAALEFEPRELWIAAHVPQLSLLALPAVSSAAPVVVLDEARNPRIIDADARAQAAGVRPGMTLGAALAAAPDIDARPRDAARELALMQRLAGIAAAFTPQVSIEAPDGLLLEIKPSIRLFGGLKELCRQLRAGLSRGRGVCARGNPAPFHAGAHGAGGAGRRAGRRTLLHHRSAPVAGTAQTTAGRVLRWPEDANERLLAMGVRTLGDLLRLPRAGFARRFGPVQLADLDRLHGRRADPRRRLARRERYLGRVDLDHEIEHHDRILEALRPLLDELEQFLRQAAARHHRVAMPFPSLRAPRRRPARCAWRCPAADAARLQSLLRERLANLTLPEPVRRCELRGGALTERPLASQPLWPAASMGTRRRTRCRRSSSICARASARDAVYGIARVPEHRPEKAWRVAEPALAPVVSEADAAGNIPFRRPLWLLHSPQELDSQRGRPRHGGALELLAGPERIESGWWDGADVQRDYYVASDPCGARFWIYRECAGTRQWFLHGIFG